MLRRRGLAHTMVLWAGFGLSSVAQADCPTNNKFSFSFAGFPAQTMNYGNSYTLTATNALGQSRTVTLSFTTNGLSSSLVNGFQMPEVSTNVNDGGTTNRNLVVGGVFSGRTTDVSSDTRVVMTRLSFATAVRDFSVQINDVDYGADQFRDWLDINGILGVSTFAPLLATPHGTNNSVPGPHGTAASSMIIGATASPLSLSVRQAGGTSASGNNSNTGTVVSTIGQPITQANVRYGNYPVTGSETQTGQQWIGIQGFSFCPMPEITLTKSAVSHSGAPVDPNRFHIPGADVIYALTITNSDTSPVDLNSLAITDIMPAQIAFRNADFDDAGPIATNFEFSAGASGLTLNSPDVTYSNNSGISYVYAPTTGYDTAINAIRFHPKGTMAPSSSFTIKFRGRIN